MNNINRPGGTPLPGRSYAMKSSMVAIESAGDLVGTTNEATSFITHPPSLL
jgi:hypothetical protein